METKEKVIVKCKPHWLSMILPVVLGVLALIGAFSYLFRAKFADAAICLVITAIFLLVAFILSKSTSLVMTETAVIGRIGIIKTKKLASPISKIQDVSVSNGLLGKIFRYSTVRISTAGSSGAEYVFKRVTNGDEIQKEFLSRCK